MPESRDRVTDLMEALLALVEHFNLDSVRVGVKVPDGHTLWLTTHRYGPVTVEREDGVSAVVTP